MYTKFDSTVVEGKRVLNHYGIAMESKVDIAKAKWKTSIEKE